MGFIPSRIRQIERRRCRTEVQCYADLSSGNYSKAVELVRVTGKLPAGCTCLVERGSFRPSEHQRRMASGVRGLLSKQPNHGCTATSPPHWGSLFEGGCAGCDRIQPVERNRQDARKSASATATPPVRHGSGSAANNAASHGAYWATKHSKAKHADCFLNATAAFLTAATDPTSN